jgi:hypothetical protein
MDKIICNIINNLKNKNELKIMINDVKKYVYDNIKIYIYLLILLYILIILLLIIIIYQLLKKNNFGYINYIETKNNLDDLNNLI